MFFETLSPWVCLSLMEGEMNTITLQRRTTATMARTLFFWVAAAVLVLFVHDMLETVSPAGCAILKMLAILGVAFAYMRMSGQALTVDAALLAGLIWAALAMAAEVVASAHGGRGWFVLLGSPAHKLVRDALLVAWIAGPALFARST